MRGFLATEEGLACVNQQLEHAISIIERRATDKPDEESCCSHEDMEQEEEEHLPDRERLKPYLFRQALYYYTCSKARHMSFVELFKDLSKYVSDPKRRWKFVVRCKRGLDDSSRPGGLYKDMAYLRGAVQILQYRKKVDFEALYCGKVALEDLLDENK